MTTVTILAIPSTHGDAAFCALGGGKTTLGSTAGEALDALTAQLSTEETGTLVVVQQFRPDSLFTASQRQRLQSLMEAWRVARDQGRSLPVSEQAELDSLVETELRAAAARSAALAASATS